MSGTDNTNIPTTSGSAAPSNPGAGNFPAAAQPTTVTPATPGALAINVPDGVPVVLAPAIGTSAGPTPGGSRSRAFIAPDANEWFSTRDDRCPNAANHAGAQFCSVCHSTFMPWGEDTPVARGIDNNGRYFRMTIGPSTGILAGVQLDNSTAVAVLSIIAVHQAEQNEMVTFAPFLQVIGQYIPSAQAGQALAGVYRELDGLARRSSSNIPVIGDIVHSALEHPHMNRAQVVAHHVANFTGANASPPENLGEVDFAAMGTCSCSSAPITNKTKFKGADKLTEEDKWELLPYYDLDPPVEGLYIPEQFFLVRRNKKDHSKLDIRQYPEMNIYDANDPKHVDRLKAWRHQIKYRSGGPENPRRWKWTKLEKEALKKTILEWIKTNGKKLIFEEEWEKITQSLAKAMNGVVQRKGDPLARAINASKGDKGQIKLLEDRDGAVDRPWTGVKAQAGKFEDIKDILDTLTATEEQKKQKKEIRLSKALAKQKKQDDAAASKKKGKAAKTTPKDKDDEPNVDKAEGGKTDDGTITDPDMVEKPTTSDDAAPNDKKRKHSEDEEDEEASPSKKSTANKKKIVRLRISPSPPIGDNSHPQPPPPGAGGMSAASFAGEISAN